jgi:hypothetical protein
VFERTVQESAALDNIFSLELLEKRNTLYGSITSDKARLEYLHADVVVTLSWLEILRSAVRNRLAVALADE